MAHTRRRSQSSGRQQSLEAWRQWRRARPFWGALLVLVGGVEILLTEASPLPLVIHIGLQGAAGYLIPVVLVLSGLLLLFHPVQRTFYALLAIILALGSWVTSNMGGFFFGMLLGIVGGSLAFAWQPRYRFDPEGRRRKPQSTHKASIGLALLRREQPADDRPADAGPPDDESATQAARLTTAPAASARRVSARWPAAAARPGFREGGHRPPAGDYRSWARARSAAGE